MRYPVSGRVPTRHRAAFTLVELLVAVAIIALLVSVVVVAARHVGNASERVDSLASLRGMGTAFASYSADHRGRFIPGYIDDDVQNELGISVTLPNDVVLAPEASASWVWRLSPYVDNDWIVFFSDNLDASSGNAYRTAYANGDYLNLSLHPRFGMNSVFVGGNSEGPGNPPSGAWNPATAATRMSQVPQPARVILFGSTVAVSGGNVASFDTGWHELRAPMIEDRQWTIGTRSEVLPEAGLNGGVPVSRTDGRTTCVVHLDGHTETPRIEDIAIDMRRWSPFADSIDWYWSP